ncbi:hypothetical protein [Candidatus Nanohalovita haloferacivicina]|uniref:hypothetical protein n=1 Tax=Candidatus Nanohalovita haloferacivicina TaxID=2978046 RepID=UPI00325FBC3F|nr:hypothetical protein HBNXNv_0644 [Candidatus Nanohalobia archaeon BNXNv]
MDAFDEIESLDYSAWDHVVDFNLKLELADIEEPQLYIGYHDEEGTPVLDLIARGPINSYINSYRLDGLSMEAFEEEGYRSWKETFEDMYGESRPLEDFFEE